jgi:hypothetical protein
MNRLKELLYLFLLPIFLYKLHYFFPFLFPVWRGALFFFLDLHNFFDRLFDLNFLYGFWAQLYYLDLFFFWSFNFSKTLYFLFTFFWLIYRNFIFYRQYYLLDGSLRYNFLLGLNNDDSSTANEVVYVHILEKLIQFFFDSQAFLFYFFINFFFCQN